MPIRGAILIFIIVLLCAIPFRNEIYEWVQKAFPDDEDNNEEENIYEEIDE